MEKWTLANKSEKVGHSDQNKKTSQASKMHELGSLWDGELSIEQTYERLTS